MQPALPDEESPFAVGNASRAEAPTGFRWRVIPCLFLAMYGTGIIGNSLVWTTMLLVERSRGVHIRFFERMDHWCLAMCLVMTCGCSLLLTCRHFWRGLWRRGFAMLLCSILFGVLVFLLTGGIRIPR